MVVQLKSFSRHVFFRFSFDQTAGQGLQFDVISVIGHHLFHVIIALVPGHYVIGDLEPAVFRIVCRRWYDFRASPSSASSPRHFGDSDGNFTLHADQQLRGMFSSSVLCRTCQVLLHSTFLTLRSQSAWGVGDAA